jgi:hypothetical protein
MVYMKFFQTGDHNTRLVLWGRVSLEEGRRKLERISFSDDSFSIDKPLDEWGHKEFLLYWDYRYRNTIHPVAPRRGPKDNIKLKAAINSSLKKYGAKTVQDMVNYAFDNCADFRWDMTNPLLVFAAHTWSAFILSRVQNKGTEIKLNGLEEMLK